LRQSGLPSLRIADLDRDHELLNIAKIDADFLLEKNPKDVSMHINRWHRNYQDVGRS
jgi:ATP-dependent DNA helicase RecG